MLVGSSIELPGRGEFIEWRSGDAGKQKDEEQYEAMRRRKGADCPSLNQGNPFWICAIYALLRTLECMFASR
jgi:hypothetical protein